MATLTGKLVADTYKALLKLIDNDVVTATEKQVSDGYGGGTGLFIDQNGFIRASKFKVTGANSSQFLKGDGSLDSTSYLSIASASSTYLTIASASSTYLTISNAASTYLPIGSTTSAIAEGSRLYFTEPRVLATPLTGFVSTSGTVTSSDTVLTSIEKIWWNIVNGGGGGGGGYVPYVGATQNLNLGTYGLISDFIQLNTTNSAIPTSVGVMSWNNTDGTADLKLKGGNVTLQIGQEQVARVVNGSGASMLESNYQVVKIIGAQGQRLQVGLAQADNDANSKDTIGLVTETIANNQEGFVTVSGLVNEIDTTGDLQGETWEDGDTLYLSGILAGGLTNVKPQAPTHTVIVGFVVYAHQNHGKIYVKVDNGYELDELHNVQITSVADKNILVYDSTLMVWQNQNIFGTQGYLPFYDNNLLMKDSVIYTNGTNVGIGSTTLTEKLVVNGNILASQFKRVGGLSTQFLKADGSIDSTQYQPYSADLTAIDALALTTGLLRKNGTDTWELDQTEYISLAFATSTYQTYANLSSNLNASATKYPSVNAVNSGLALKLNLTGGTLTGDLILDYSYPKIALSDISSGTIWNIQNDGSTFELNYGATNKFYIFSSGNAAFSNDLTANKLIKAGGLSTEFLKADGSVDSTNYQPYDADLAAIAALALTTGLLRKNGMNTWELDQTEYISLAFATSTYQTLANLSSNLNASSTKYPSVNAVNTGLNSRLALTGGSLSGDLAISSSIPTLQLSDTSSGTIWNIQNDGGGFEINSGITNKFVMYSSGNATFVNDLTANKFIKSGGTSAQFLMADGSTSSGPSGGITGTLTTNYIPKASGTNTIDNSVIQEIGGIVGIGSTPSNWDYSGSIQLPNGGIYATRGSNNMLIAGALYNSGWKRNTVGFASMFEQNLGGFTWYTAPSGAGLSDITWQQLMNLNPSGRLLINQTTDDGVNLIQANGAIISTAFKKSGGISSQFLKADGSVDSSVYITGITSPMVITALGFTPYNATNPSGFISSNQNITLSGDVSGSGPTSITTTLATITQASSGSFVKITLDTKGRVTGNVAVGSSDITSALGYTPYNSTNPSGYISGITSLMVTNALGYTPYNSSNPAGYTTNVGTVTSVAMSVPTGLSISGSPITTSGTLALSLSAGYSIPTTSSQGTWDTAYNRSLTSIGVSGTTTKTLTLTKQDGTTLSASWSDINTDAVTSVFGRTGAIVATSGDYTTTQVTESGNLYYLDSRARASISGGTGISYNSTTGVITNTITQYTDALARASISGGTGISYNSTSGVITNTITQYTDALARASLSFVAGSGAYNSTTGVITIPTNTSQLTNGAGYITGITSLMVTNALGYTPVTNARQLTINGTTYDLSADRSWTISGTIGGLISGFIPKATSASTLGNSLIYDDGTSIGINNTSPQSFASGGVKTIDGKGSSGFAYIAQGALTQIRLVSDDSIGGLINVIGAYPLAFFTNGSEKMRLTSAGNLGIGTTTPSGKLDISNTNNSFVNILSSDANASSVLSMYNSSGTTDGAAIGYNVAMRFGTITGANAAGFTERMRITAGGNLLVGTTSFSGTYNKLAVAGGISVIGDNNGKLEIGRYSSGASNAYIKLGANANSLRFTNNTDIADIMELTNSGNLGLGVTPSAWSLGKAFEINSAGNSVWSYSNDNIYLTQNSTFNGGWYYGATATAAQYVLFQGKHLWMTAPSGTAGTAISFTQAMTLDASGNLMVGTTTPLLTASGRGNITVNGSSTSILTFGIAGAYSGYIYSTSSNLEFDAQGARYIQFNTNGLERARITSGGNVLINTTTDSGYKLDVNGEGRIQNTLTIKTPTNATAIALLGRSADNYSALRFLSNNAATNYATIYTNASDLLLEVAGSTRLTISSTGAATFSSSVQAGNNFVAKGTLNGYSGAGIFMSYESYGGRIESYDYSTSAYKNITIAPNGGNVGIGTTSPSTLMHLEASTPFLLIKGTGSGEFGLKITDGSTSLGGLTYNSTTGEQKLNGAQSYIYQTFYSGGSERMRITSGGNVLIGTTTDSGYKLDVNGTGRFSGSLTAGSLLRVIEGGYNRFFEVSESSIKLYGGGDPSIKFGDYNTGVDKTATIGFEDNYFGRGTLSFRVKGQASGTGITALSLASTGAATFSSSLTVNGGYIRNANTATSGGLFMGNGSIYMAYDGTNINFVGAPATFSSSVTATGYFESSSIAYKNILATNPTTALNVDVIKYTRKNVDTDDVRYGYSAEQINSLMPELTNKDVTAVKYLDVHTLLIAELQREIKELKAKLN